MYRGYALMRNLPSFLMINVQNDSAFTPESYSGYVSKALAEELNEEERQSICCDKGMRCCKRSMESEDLAPQIQIRAVLAKCPNSQLREGILTQTQQMSQSDIQNAESVNGDNVYSDDMNESSVVDCTKKILITIKINHGSVSNKHQYIVVDHVFDILTKRSQLLLNPYVIKLKVAPPTQSYPLKFVNYVNSEANEVVFNKNQKNYTGCSTDTKKPTCGLVTFKGKIIPYSQGFCCSCDPLKNTKNQPNDNGKIDEDNFDDPGHLLDGKDECCPSDKSESQNIIFKKRRRHKVNEHIYDHKPAPGIVSQAKKSNILWSQDDTNSIINKVLSPVEKRSIYFDYRDDEYSELNDRLARDINCKPDKRDRQSLSGGVQTRGGQNCADRYTPPDVDPDTYHDSTHCLKFSDIWYGIHQLREPFLDETISLEIFEKQGHAPQKVNWRDFNEGKPVVVGVFSPSYTNKEATASFKYIQDSTSKNVKFALDHRSMRLLIPEGNEACDMKKNPELEGGAAHYLVLRYDKMRLEGDQCNIPGVGFEAFYKQPKRCSNPKGTCLSNQPKALWKHDYEALKHGRKGCFFLQNFAQVPQKALSKNNSDNFLHLGLQFAGKMSSSVDIELNADSNIVLRQDFLAIITEVYVDSTSPTKTILTIKVTNSGLVASKYMTKLNDCPLGLSSSLKGIESRIVLIPPQHQHVFTLKLHCKLPVDLLRCSVEVMNAMGQVVALRRIKIAKSDRCICIWHCLCACVSSLGGLKCRSMPLEHYHAAGFQGGLPVPTYIIHNSYFDDMITMLFYVLIFVLLTLFLLGLSKAVIGLCCCAPVGVWGLNILLDLPKKLPCYYEPGLRDWQVIYDDQGWPVRPDTHMRARNISKSTEFCTNVVFFFTFPVVVLLAVCKKVCCAADTRAEDNACLCNESCPYKEKGDICPDPCVCPGVGEEEEDVWDEQVEEEEMLERSYGNDEGSSELNSPQGEGEGEGKTPFKSSSEKEGRNAPKVGAKIYVKNKHNKKSSNRANFHQPTKNNSNLNQTAKDNQDLNQTTQDGLSTDYSLSETNKQRSSEDQKFKSNENANSRKPNKSKMPQMSSQGPCEWYQNPCEPVDECQCYSSDYN